MKLIARIPAVALLLLFAVLLNGCLFRSHKVQPAVNPAQLKTATQQQLIDRINGDAAKIKTLNLTVDIATSVGGAKKGKVTDFKEIRGYVLLRKPNMLRLIGLMPIVRNKAFDMVSDGKDFKLWVPPTNKYYVGPRDVVYRSPNQLENLRPQIFYDALLLKEIDPENEIAVMESSTELVQDPKSKRQLDEQQIFDVDRNMVTDAKYSDLKDYSGLTFPTVIEIERPLEEYAVTMTVVKLKLNEAITDEQFALAQPQNQGPANETAAASHQNASHVPVFTPISRAVRIWFDLAPKLFGSTTVPC